MACVDTQCHALDLRRPGISSLETALHLNRPANCVGKLQEPREIGLIPERAKSERGGARIARLVPGSLASRGSFFRFVCDPLSDCVARGRAERQLSGTASRLPGQAETGSSAPEESMHSEASGPIRSDRGSVEPEIPRQRSIKAELCCKPPGRARPDSTCDSRPLAVVSLRDIVDRPIAVMRD